MAAPRLQVVRPERRLDDVRPEARRGSRWASSPIRAGSDRRLARRASRGDRRAIAIIFERYQQELYRFCLGLLGEPQDAQDALQNTMVKVLRALPGEEREIALRPWLYRIAHNEAIELRRSRHPTQALDGYLVDGQASVTERAEQREHLEWLLKDLGDLPERQRAVLVMRELSGLDFAEIGAALDASGAVIRQSLYEARRNLEQMDRGRSLKCETVARVLSDADGRITRRRDIRAHLRDCPDCRRFRDAIDRREGVLASMPPLPAAVAVAGIAQTTLGGSSGGGAVAALTGSAAKSAGAYGALKAAGTIAAVAVVSTVAIQGEMKHAAPGSPPRGPLAQAKNDSSRLLPRNRVKAVSSASTVSPSPRFVQSGNEASPALSAVRVSDRQPRSLPAMRREPAPMAVARPTAGPHTAAYADHPPTGDFEAKPAPEEAKPAPEEAKGSPSNAGKDAGRAQEPEKQTGPPPKPKKEKPGHPVHPSHSNKATATPDTVPSAPSESDPEQPKVPPGQAKKQAKAEAQPPPPASPPPVETEPAEAGAEATQPATGHEPKGKAKGHAS